MYSDKTRYFYITVYYRSIVLSNEAIEVVHYEKWFYVDGTYYMVGKFDKGVKMIDRWGAIANIALNSAISEGMTVSAMKYINKRGGKRKRKNEVSSKQMRLF